MTIATPTHTLPASLIAKVEEYVSVRLKREELEPQYKAIKAQEDALSAELCKLIESAGLKSIDHAQYGKLIASFKGPYAKIRKMRQSSGPDGEEEWEVDETARQELEEFTKGELDAAGNPLFETLFKLMPVSSRLSAEVARRIEEGLPMLPGVEHYTLDRVTWRRSPELKRKEQSPSA